MTLVSSSTSASPPGGTGKFRRGCGDIRIELLSPIRQMRNEHIEPLIVHAHNDETVILRRTDHIHNLARRNCNGGLMGAFSCKSQYLQIDAIGLR
jgi:hypothetical protein